MSSWYYMVSSNLDEIPNCINHFESELVEARKELSLKGLSIEKHCSELPGRVEHRFGQLQEIEAILNFINITYRKLRTQRFKTFLETYNRTLSSADAGKYADGDSDVVDMALLENEFALLRNKFLGITKGLDQKSYMSGHIVKLKCAGLDDAQV